MQHNFKTSLNKGQVGEEFLLKNWPELKRLDGRNADFEFPDGKTLELKTDYYCMTKTDNLFIECISNNTKNTPGGPWQAASKNIDFFAYLYIKNSVVLLFDTRALIDFLDKAAYPERRIPNKGYVTIGFLVPRSDVEHLAQKWEAPSGDK